MSESATWTDTSAPLSRRARGAEPVSPPRRDSILPESERGSETKSHADERDQPDGKDQHPQIDGDLLQPGDLGHLGGDQRPHPRHRRDDSQHPADRGQDQTLGEQLPDDPGSRSAQRGANRQLGSPGQDLAEPEVGDIEAGDQQH